MEKNNEKLKTMVLFCLMFGGINYALFTFMVQPKMLLLEEVQASYERGGESQNIYDALVIDKEGLEAEIAELNSYEDRFGELAQSEFDTLQLTYDFYSYASEQGITGLDASYEIEEILAYAQSLEALATMTEEEREEMEADEDYELTDLSAPAPYLTVSSSLNLQMKAEQLEATLDSLPEISGYHLYPYEVRLISEEITLTSTEDLVAGGTYDEDEDKFIAITLSLNYKTFLVTGDELSEAVEGYDFYNEQEGHEDLMDLFAPSKENDTSADNINEAENNQESESGTDTNQ